MCQQLNCPHKGERMCSCVELDPSKRTKITAHFLKNLTGMKLELSYNTLLAPAPYRLCVAGTCGTCGGRLCVSAGMPAHLSGEGLLTMVLGHVIHLDLSSTDQFVELFHEEDRPAARCWLESLTDTSGRPALPEREAPVETSAIGENGGAL